MAFTSKVLDQRFASPPEPDLKPADLLARAEAISATLVDRQAETERRTFYAPDTHQTFAESGLYRIMVPRRYGGYEFGLDTFLRVVMTVARGCPSTGWMYCLGAAHSLLTATLFDARAQAEIFACGDFIAPAVIEPGGTARRAGNGDWVLNGTWRYCSGAPYATHFIGHAMVVGRGGQPLRPMLFIAPRSQWTRLDDWGSQLGLRGSGSHSIAFHNGRIPGHFALEPGHLSEISVTGGTPGRALHPHPQYGGAPVSSMCLEGASLGVGIARGALDAYEQTLTTRTTAAPPIVRRVEDPDFQRWYGQAAALLATAEAATLNAIQQWLDLCERGPAAFTPEQDLLIAMICREAAELAWRAVEQIIQPTAGSSSIRAGERIERVWRDLSACHSHAGFAVLLPTAMTRAYTQTHFGLAGTDPA
jgi:3-hydroxy-9,10-secoandrosta-1,3,5(10)-triene-9,17-dione monooxygenase